jgi:Ca2+-binding RTX toxin-like protein
VSLTGVGYRGTTLVLLALYLLPVSGAAGAGNPVPGSNLTRYQAAITANTLKPSACTGITLTNVIARTTGTGAANLLLGSAAGNSMSARGGSDCVLGGGGNDSINCGGGTDVAVGGPGSDTFSSNCETRIQ